MENRQSIEERITLWREQLQRHVAIRPGDAKELEDKLRSQIEALIEVGLNEGEAFLVAVKRLGDVDSLWREYAQEYSERLWKQLFPASPPGERATRMQRDTLVAIGMAIAAAVAVKIPRLFGIGFGDSPVAESFYARNFSLFILPFLTGYFAWKRGLDRGKLLMIAIPFVAAALLVNLLPFVHTGATEMLAMIHLPIALCFAAGIAYMGGKWDDHIQRMNLICFSGEWVIYSALIALGGGVLTALTVFIFNSIGVHVEPIVPSWLLPCGAAGALVISGWLVEAKQSMIGNLAPVLTRLFTPLFALLLLSYIVVMLLSGRGILVERELLIGFDILLVLILGLLLYSISARDPQEPPNMFDTLQLILALSALFVDLLALRAIGRRISEFGFSPNKVAALGENLILLVNLGGSALLYARFLFRRTPFTSLIRWQTAYIPVYPIWTGIVAVVFPIVFDFR